jgi:hypothetical protein
MKNIDKTASDLFKSIETLYKRKIKMDFDFSPTKNRNSKSVILNKSTNADLSDMKGSQLIERNKSNWGRNEKKKS